MKKTVTDAEILEAVTEYIRLAREADLKHHKLSQIVRLFPAQPQQIRRLAEWHDYETRLVEWQKQRDQASADARIANAATATAENDLKDLLPPVWYVIEDLGVKVRYDTRNETHPQVRDLEPDELSEDAESEEVASR